MVIPLARSFSASPWAHQADGEAARAWATPGVVLVAGQAARFWSNQSLVPPS